MDWVPTSSSLPPQTSYIEALTTDVMVFGGRVYQRWLNFDEVMRVGSHGGISTLMRRDEDRAPVFSFCLPREGTAEKSAVWKPGGGLSDCGTSPPQNCGKQNSIGKATQCGILLLQPERTQTRAHVECFSIPAGELSGYPAADQNSGQQQRSDCLPGIRFVLRTFFASNLKICLIPTGSELLYSKLIWTEIHMNLINVS